MLLPSLHKPTRKRQSFVWQVQRAERWGQMSQNASHSMSSAAAHVRIVMATCNGGPYLSGQLQSLLAQTHRNWSLHVGDDGSNDDTRLQVRAFAAANPDREIVLVAGPSSGSAANFLTQAAAAARPGEWLAFADQDDVWLPHKITRALEQVGMQDRPAAYSCRSIHTDLDLTPLHVSVAFDRPPHFANALVQNVLSGHAILLTPSAAALVARYAGASVAAGVPFHDWWIYQLITGAGGDVVLDTEPGLYYRQHHQNALGAHHGWRASVARLRLLGNRDYAGWVDRNLAALTQCQEVLTPQAATLLRGFMALRSLARSRDRVRALDDLGLYRQSPTGDRVLRILARLGRL